jgi:alginate O-acetyltransferase complex protein AlgI
MRVFQQPARLQGEIYKMVFSSIIFLFLFLPFFLGAYYLTPYRWRSYTILVGSYIFYAWWRVDFLLLFAGVTLWNHFCGKRILANEGSLRARRWIQTGVAGDLLVLGIFKYFNFGVESLNDILTASGMNSIEALGFILPIGISFYIFQSISFLIDLYRKDAPPARRFIDFAAFISLFPQLIAGPVLRYKDLAHQFENRTHSFDKFSQGAYRFMIGFSKKVLIADSVSPLVDKTFALENPAMGDAWLGTLAYTVQLYFDFSGYSDMAIGLGLMMGFRFMENFNHPYISSSITEFWRRWHISLSSWLRDYLYIPLGGNRKGTLRTYINLLITMLLGGLWHGANWTFIFWGGWHGIILAAERLFGKKSAKDDRYYLLSRLPGLAITQFFVIIGWVMFRSPDTGKAFSLYQSMFGFNGLAGLSEQIQWQIYGYSLTALIAGFFLIYCIPLLQVISGVNYKETSNLWIHIFTALLFVLGVIKLIAQSYSPFLYFQF